MRLWIGFFLFVFWGSCAAPDPALNAQPGRPGDPAQNLQTRVVGEYIAILKPGANPDQLKGTFSEYGAHSIAKIDRDTYVFKVHKDPGPTSIEKKGSSASYIVKVQPNFIYRQLPGGPGSPQ